VTWRGRLEAFLNCLLEASICALTSEEHAAYDGSTALDATPVPLFSRGPSKRAGLCASDPTAATSRSRAGELSTDEPRDCILSRHRG
jgi:hypothetical protein